MQRDSLANTLRVSILLCLVCSLLVSAAAVGLRSAQQANKERDKQKNILIAAGLFDKDADSIGDVPEKFKQIETRIIDMKTGEYVSEVETASFDQKKAARDPEQSTQVADDDDVARIRRRENRSFVYLVNDSNGDPVKAVLPIRGYGLWSTMWGFIAIDLASLEGGPQELEVAGLTYYQQGETPGLGGEVDNQKWKDLWPGKHVYDKDWNVKVEVTKAAAGAYEVDALSGATITSNGVTNMMRYWFGKNGFRPYLKKVHDSL